MGDPVTPFLVGASSILGISEQRKARKETVRANRAQERAAAIQNARARRKSRAEAKVATAANVASGASQGLLGSSSLSGITSSIQTQLTSNESFQRQLQSLDQKRFSSLTKATKSQANADTFSSLSKLASTIGPRL